MGKLCTVVRIKINDCQSDLIMLIAKLKHKGYDIKYIIIRNYVGNGIQ